MHPASGLVLGVEPSTSNDSFAHFTIHVKLAGGQTEAAFSVVAKRSGILALYGQRKPLVTGDHSYVSAFLKMANELANHFAATIFQGDWEGADFEFEILPEDKAKAAESRGDEG